MTTADADAWRAKLRAAAGGGDVEPTRCGCHSLGGCTLRFMLGSCNDTAYVMMWRRLLSACTSWQPPFRCLVAWKGCYAAGGTPPDATRATAIACVAVDALTRHWPEHVPDALALLFCRLTNLWRETMAPTERHDAVVEHALARMPRHVPGWGYALLDCMRAPADFTPDAWGIEIAHTADTIAVAWLRPDGDAFAWAARNRPILAVQLLRAGVPADVMASAAHANRNVLTKMLPAALRHDTWLRRGPAVVLWVHGRSRVHGRPT